MLKRKQLFFPLYRAIYISRRAKNRTIFSLLKGHVYVAFVGVSLHRFGSFSMLIYVEGIPMVLSNLKPIKRLRTSDNTQTDVQVDEYD